MNKQWSVLLFASLVVGTACGITRNHKPEGMGGLTKGGAGGRVIKVTSLEDSEKDPQPGTLRWALNQEGPRIIKFDVSGTIRLDAPLQVTEGFVTIDGEDAPGMGITIRDHSTYFIGAKEIIVRNIRFRRGDVTQKKELEETKEKRLDSSYNLDCLDFELCDNVLVEHCSFSWSTDELLSVQRTTRFTAQWNIFAYPLMNDKLHPYGDQHAFCAAVSSSDVTFHHNLFATYLMRAPQMNPAQRDGAKMEAINNICFNGESGPRATLTYDRDVKHGDPIEDGTHFHHIINNYIIGRDKSVRDVSLISKNGINTKGGRLCIKNNIGPNRPRYRDPHLANVFDSTDDLVTESKYADDILPMISTKQRLFRATVPVSIESVQNAYKKVIAEAGCFPRDSVDERAINEVKTRTFRPILESQDEIGGWPNISGTKEEEEAAKGVRYNRDAFDKDRYKRAIKDAEERM